MRRWMQYGGLAGLLTVCLAAGVYGFTSTGGALPYAERFGQALQRGARDGGGPLVDLGRGVVIAGPISEGGLVTEYVAVVLVLVAIGVGLYLYAVRYRSESDGDRDDGRDAV